MIDPHYVSTHWVQKVQQPPDIVEKGNIRKSWDGHVMNPLIQNTNGYRRIPGLNPPL
jgi:hypothetical protein